MAFLTKNVHLQVPGFWGTNALHSVRACMLIPLATTAGFARPVALPKWGNISNLSTSGGTSGTGGTTIVQAAGNYTWIG